MQKVQNEIPFFDGKAFLERLFGDGHQYAAEFRNGVPLSAFRCV